MNPPRDVRQQLADLPEALQQKLLQFAIVATAMNDQEREAAIQAVVSRSYFAAKVGDEVLVPLAEMDLEFAHVLRLTSGSAVGA